MAAIGGAGAAAAASRLNRCAARAAGLSHDELADLIGELSVTSDARSLIDTALAQRQPLPEWAVSNVLTSPDLLPHILTAKDVFNSWDCAISRVCKQWHQTWAATVEQRRGLRECKPLDLGSDPTGIFDATPCGSYFCWKPANLPDAVHVYDGEMRRQRTIFLAVPDGVPAVDELFLSSTSIYATYFTEGFSGAVITRHQLSNGEFESALELREHPHVVDFLVDRYVAVHIGPHGVLALGRTGSTNRLLALDEITLTPRYVHSFEECVSTLAFGDGELFVGEVDDGDADRPSDGENVNDDACIITVRAYRLDPPNESGTLIPGGRVIHSHVSNSGSEISLLKYARGRLYVVYEYGHSIHVLSPQGDVLQVFEPVSARAGHPMLITTLAPFGNQLFIRFYTKRREAPRSLALLPGL